MMKEKGQILLEALIALAVATIILSALSVAAITSITNSNFSRDQNLATSYAQQGKEVLRKQSESDWTSFSANSSGTYCLGNDNILISPSGSGCVPNTGTNNYFIRKVIINTNATTNCGSTTSVSVVVLWSGGKCSGSSYCHSVNLDSCFTNINALPAL